MSWELYADRRNTDTTNLKRRRLYPQQISETTSKVEVQQSFEFSFAASTTSKSLVSEKKTTNRNNPIDAVLPFSAWPVGELSEVRTKNDENIFHLLLPLLSKLNSEKRWITLISPPSDIDKKLFAYHGIDVSRVLLIHPKDSVDDTVTMNKALKNGTSGIVIMWTDKLPLRFAAQWRKSVKQGNCRGVIVNHDTEEHFSPSIALSLDVKTSSKAISINSLQRFGKKMNYRAKRSFPIITDHMELDEFSLAN